jgi:hypothetical protein
VEPKNAIEARFFSGKQPLQELPLPDQEGTQKKRERKLYTNSSLPTTTADCHKGEVFSDEQGRDFQKQNKIGTANGIRNPKDERTKSLQGRRRGGGGAGLVIVTGLRALLTRTEGGGEGGGRRGKGAVWWKADGNREGKRDMEAEKYHENEKEKKELE